MFESPLWTSESIPGAPVGVSPRDIIRRRRLGKPDAAARRNQAFWLSNVIGWTRRARRNRGSPGLACDAHKRVPRGKKLAALACAVPARSSECGVDRRSEADKNPMAAAHPVRGVTTVGVVTCAQ